MIRSLFNCDSPWLFTREFFEGDAGGAGGGAADPAKEKPKDDDKVTLTKAQLDKQKADAVQAALDAKKAEDEAAAKKAKEEADRKAAEQKGEHQKLYEAEKAAREKAEADKKAAEDAAALKLKNKDADIALRDFLTDKHPDYVKSAPYIRPLITVTADTKDEDLKKAIEKAAEQFVKDNPRRVGTGVPSRPNRLTPSVVKKGEKPNEKGETDEEEAKLSTAIRQGF
jgi:hypothetical protein